MDYVAPTGSVVRSWPLHSLSSAAVELMRVVFKQAVLLRPSTHVILSEQASGEASDPAVHRDPTIRLTAHPVRRHPRGTRYTARTMTSTRRLLPSRPCALREQRLEVNVPPGLQGRSNSAVAGVAHPPRVVRARAHASRSRRIEQCCSALCLAWLMLREVYPRKASNKIHFVRSLSTVLSPVVTQESLSKPLAARRAMLHCKSGASKSLISCCGTLLRHYNDDFQCLQHNGLHIFSDT